MPATPNARTQANQINTGVLLSIKRDYVYHRCGSVFELIRDYPATEASVIELVRAIRSSCMTLPNDFVEKILDSLRTRLLISSISTEDVLQFFISSMKVLGMIDSSGCVRDTVCRRIHFEESLSLMALT